MRDLRLIGVHEDGQHLLLSDGEGERYRVPLDDALRAATRRDRAHLGQLQIEMEGGLRPREVQALIRSGLSAEEVAERSGWTIEKVHRYEAPVLAEREHVAALARGVRMRSRGTAGGPTLAARAGARLRDRGVDPTQAVWDAARREDGRWTVSVRFPAGGRERVASWVYDSEGQGVQPKDDEARWLSGDDDDQTGPIPTGASVAPGVYDVEAEGGLETPPRPRRTRTDEPIDLTAALRDASMRHRHRPRSRHQPTLPVGDEQAEGVSPPVSAPEPAQAPTPDDRQATDDPVPGTVSEEAPAADPVVAARPARRTRPSVPSWDDVMFGAKPRESAARSGGEGPTPPE